MAEYDVIIVGAGISGLSLAHYCAKANLKTLVLEKSERAGGAIHSQTFEGDAGDFWVELGAHTCYNSYAGLIGILEDNGAIDSLTPREKAPFKILVNGEPKAIPSQLSFTSLIPAAWRLFTLKKKGESLKSYYSKLVGSRNYENVLKYAFEAVVSQPAADFPAEVLFKKRDRRKDIIRKFTFTDGLQAIPNCIAGEKNIEIVTGASVKTIEHEDGRFLVKTEGKSFEGDRLALASPASVAADLLKQPFPDIAEKLAGIGVRKVETMGVAVEKEAVSLEPVANMFPQEDIFFSAVSRDVLPHPKFRGFTFHFKPDVADAEAKLQRIGEVLKVSQEKLTRKVTKANCVPCLKVGHDQLVEQIDRLCADKNLFLAGNYFLGLAVEDCVNRSQAEFNRLSSSLS